MSITAGVANLISNAAASAGAKLNQMNESPLPALYKPNEDNWYRSLPYAFRAKINGQDRIFYLPINPKNISITTHFATNVITTLYGTIEEHSEQRYFDITISGTTGLAPQFIDSIDFKEGIQIESQSTGRLRYSDFSISSALGGFFPKTLGKIDQALNQAGNAFKNISGGNVSNKNKIGVFNDKSGYLAFHNLYKFLLEYKRTAVNSNKMDKSKTINKSNTIIESMNSHSDSDHSQPPLLFLNFKDNNQYNCAVSRFVLERSAENPLLYNYNIQMRAYNLSPITSFSPEDLNKRYKDLGLDSSLSVAAKLKLSISNGKSIMSTGKSALSTLGA